MNTAVDQWPKRHLITVDEYYRMAEVGLLAPDARVELIEGEVIDMAPIGSSHAGIVNYLARYFFGVVGERATVTVQQPVRLSPRSEPQPDLSLLKPRTDLYRKGHPSPTDVLLLIEVSDSTLRFDLGLKAAMYARHGIPELWVVDIEGRCLHCLRMPVGEVYQYTSVLRTGQCAAAALPDVAVDLAALFD
jgi:Uma2 family endonuclease